MFDVARDTLRRCWPLWCLLLGGAVGCTTIPEGAPQEFYQAERVLAHAADRNVADRFPETIKRADAAFRAAIAKWRDLEERNAADEVARLAIISAVNSVNSMVYDATAISEKIGTWDIYAQAPSTLDAAARFLTEKSYMLAELGELPSQFMQHHAPLNYAAPVAFFATNDTKVAETFGYSVAQLAELMERDEAIMVTLVGYADTRGAERYNADLAKSRALEVKRILTDLGIGSARIRISSFGEALAQQTTQEGEWALDRRVDAYITRALPLAGLDGGR